MMVREDALSGTKAAHRGADLLDQADGFVAEHRSGLAPDIPRHDVAGADPAGAGADQDILRAHFRAGHFLDANVSEVVKQCGKHKSYQTLGSGLADVNLVFAPKTRGAPPMISRFRSCGPSSDG